MNPELVANPAKFSANIDSSPLPPPMSSTSMKMPQNTPNAVSSVRVLFLVSESYISPHWSLSMRILGNAILLSVL